MLRIERLQVIGFKSFHERTEMRFMAGITAVVGPNGCGKSNIGDAIHWVLGEQSARTLRGERMEDVIFAGSESRKPLGMAEVTLRLTGTSSDSCDGSVDISRRLYRSGESEYLLDGRRARLKDIQEVLSRAHVGARTYAVIEQGKVEALLTARPKDRRLLIEEAAGIIGYKHKKRLAEVKLEGTEANLLRVSDVVNEVGRQLGSLKRQAARARRYRRLQEAIRSRQRLLFSHQALGLDLLLEQVRGRIALASDREAAEAANAARLEAAVERTREQLSGVELEIASRREQLHRIELETDRETNRRSAILQRIVELDAEVLRWNEDLAALDEREMSLSDEARSWRAQMDQVSGALQGASSRRGGLEARCAEAAARASSLREGLDLARREALLVRDRLVEARNEHRRLEEERRRNASLIERLSSELEQARRELRERQGALEAARRERRRTEEAQMALAADLGERERQRERIREEAASAGEACEEALNARAASAERLRTLTDATTRFSGKNEAVGYILSRAGPEGIRTQGVVADYVQAGLDAERAAEGYLADLLPAVLVKENEDAMRGIEALRREGAGRCLFMVERNGHTISGGSKEIPEGLAGESGVLGTLAAKLTAAAPYNGLLTERLPDAVLVEDLPLALKLHRLYPAHNFVTREGDVVYASGMVSGGRSTEAGEGLLAQNRAIAQARDHLREVGRRAEETSSRLAAARVEVGKAEAAASEAAVRKTEMEKSHLTSGLGEERAAEELARVLRSEQLLAQEREAASSEGESLERRSVEVEGGVERLAAELQCSEDRLQAVESEGRALDDSLLASGEELGKLRSEEAALSERRDGIGREMARLEESMRETGARKAAGREAVEAAGARRAELETEADRTLTRLEDLHRSRGTESDRLAASEGSAAELRQAICLAESEARTAREALDAARVERQQGEVESARLASDRAHIEERCRQELSQSIDEARRESGGPAAGDGFDPAACEEEIPELRRKIDSIGPVNMMALDEFVELEKRFQFLTAQKQDLVASVESLRETIRKINRSTRDRLVDAFEQIRRNFNEVFRLLFGGGRADLRLEESADPLEASLEVIAQPPGKRLQAISLLSGGEKSMTAIALLFAVFRYQPSPFCLMDEVDAALDDLNVGRFTRMLKEYSRDTQFIVVTHNPRSMEVADVLYGVTMPEPGITRVVSMRLPEAVAATQ